MDYKSRERTDTSCDRDGRYDTERELIKYPEWKTNKNTKVQTI